MNLNRFSQRTLEITALAILAFSGAGCRNDQTAAGQPAIRVFNGTVSSLALRQTSNVAIRVVVPAGTAQNLPNRVSTGEMTLSGSTSFSSRFRFSSTGSGGEEGNSFRLAASGANPNLNGNLAVLRADLVGGNRVEGTFVLADGAKSLRIELNILSETPDRISMIGNLTTASSGMSIPVDVSISARRIRGEIMLPSRMGSSIDLLGDVEEMAGMNRLVDRRAVAMMLVHAGLLSRIASIQELVQR